MKTFIPIIGISVVALAMVKAQDPVKVDPTHYKVILDNDYVRVMDVRHKPGDKTHMHSRPNHVVYSFHGGTVKLTSSDGKTETRTFKAGQAIWHNAVTQTEENVGKNEIHGLVIELKK